MKSIFIQGERLYLRPLDLDDLERCMCWINDPQILEFLGRRLPIGREQEKEWISGQYKDDREVQLAIALNDGDRHIGNCGLCGIDYADRSGEFGIMIGEPDVWGQGYGPEATRLMVQYGFRQLGLHRIQLEVYAFNERARMSYEKVGFRLEGTRRQSYFRNGRFHDAYLMAILESEWTE
jgi:RimJ/RimL family protein N-acetyltransferase